VGSPPLTNIVNSSVLARCLLAELRYRSLLRKHSSRHGDGTWYHIGPIHVEAPTSTGCGSIQFDFSQTAFRENGARSDRDASPIGVPETRRAELTHAPSHGHFSCQAKQSYASSSLHLRLKKRNSVLIVHTNNKKLPIDNGDSLRDYTRRWMVEQTCAWLGKFCRLQCVMTIHSPPTNPSFSSLAPGSHSEANIETGPRMNDLPKTLPTSHFRLAFGYLAR
jgi:hypothetical protein